MRELGRLDFLIANAPLTIEAPIVEMTAEVFDTVVRTNLHGVFHVLSPALKIMTAQKRGGGCPSSARAPDVDQRGRRTPLLG